MDSTKTSDASAVASGSANQKWSLSASNVRGKLHLQWSHAEPWRPQQGQIRVYNNNFPGNPTDDTKTWTWDDVQNGDSWDTGVDFGPGWNCAYIGKDYKSQYTYIIQIVTS